MAEGSSTGTEVPVSKAVTETEVRVSGADAGAVVPVRTAVTTATSLSEADIATIVDRVTRNLQPSILGGAPVCPTSSEGEGEPVVPLLWCVWGAAGQSGLCGSQICTLRYSVGGGGCSVCEEGVIVIVIGDVINTGGFA